MDSPKNMFSGENADQYNAMADALIDASGGWDQVYSFIERMPRASLIVAITNSLLSLGYKITKP